jgi:putative tricarboxylic transport membrane protein
MVTYWRDAIQKAVESGAWTEAAEKNQWVTTFMVGDELDAYLERTNQQVIAAFEKIGQQ